MEFQAPVLRRLGDKQVMENVTLEEPRGGEVLVRMAAAGICHSCVSAADGSFPDTPVPLILGDEGAGVVEAVGPGCQSLQPGDHVILSWAPGCGRCVFCAQGRPGLCRQTAPFGYLRDGTARFRVGDEEILHFGPATYSPYVVVEENAAVAIRRDMPLDKAALIGCAVTTGVGAALNSAKVRPGESAVIFGCGGIGLNAVQGAALAGARPLLAVDVIGMKLEAAGRLGATHQVDASQGDPVERIRALTGGQGVDHAIVAVGSTRVMEQAIAALAPGGGCVLVGAPPAGPTVALDPMHLVGGERRVVGCRYGSANPHAMFPKLVELYLSGQLKLDELVSRRYRPDEVNEASQALVDGHDLRGLLVFGEN